MTGSALRSWPYALDFLLLLPHPLSHLPSVFPDLLNTFSGALLCGGCEGGGGGRQNKQPSQSAATPREMTIV